MRYFILIAIGALGLASCDSAVDSTSLSGKSTAESVSKVFIPGSDIIRQVTDAQTVEAVRREFLTKEALRSRLPVSIQAIQVEEIEGRQYMTVLATDKNGFCVSSARRITSSTQGNSFARMAEEQFGCLGSFCKFCQRGGERDACGCTTPAFPDDPRFPGTCSEYSP